MMKNILILMSLLLVFSCNKEGGQEQTSDFYATNGVYICNEGNFMYGNASLSFYDTNSKVVTNQLFFSVNKFPLGDVLQSVTIDGYRMFLVVNNSGKVYIADTHTGKHLGTISELTSPRYVEIVSPSKAYISDLYSGIITIINPVTAEKTGSIDIGASSETMTSFDGYTYVCNWRSSGRVFKIDNKTDRVISSLDVTFQPNSMVVDRNGYLWVLSDGGDVSSPLGYTFGTLTCIDLSTFKVVKTLSMRDKGSYPMRLTINKTGNMMYFLNAGVKGSAEKGGVYKVPIDATSMPISPVIAEDKHAFYALGVDPISEDIYVSDAIDYAQKGIVYVYEQETVSSSVNGYYGQGIEYTMLPKLDNPGSFKVDICPSYFAFVNSTIFEP